MKKEFRIEKDILGSLKVPSDAYYGIQTLRASENFRISNLRINPELNKAIIQIKIAAAKANTESHVLDKKISEAIIKAGNKILKENFEKEFIIDVFQAGAGTPWHMNVNEVIANVALELSGKKKGDYKHIDPHNHVNMSQSTNDVVPTAIRISSIELTKKLTKEIENLIASLEKKAREFHNLIKSGRTHLQDAVPITLGQEFNAYASTIKKRLELIKTAENNLKFLQIGGTAVGTGLNASPNFAKLILKNLNKNLNLNLKNAENKIEETQFMTDFLDISSALRSLAVDLGKISNDLRLLASGPLTGINEISLPQIQPGSSIMPGKFNPSMAEMMNMVCYQILGNDETIKESASAGQLELNVMTPVLAHNLLQSLEILTSSIKEFNSRCIKGIKANKEILQEYFEKTPSAATALNPILGYDKTSILVREALKNKISVKELAIKKGLIKREEADRIFNIKNFIK